ncbi:molybdopterin converting factor subunit 1 [Pseudenhygromyxa sp. WMMC2535]|uniref:molybdopterin converting factor subunit 1 n=1 Tax=Pseudenhygromyxa sp. WMMC2535 TaxID=2712867 RepID=UPI00155832E2|nr:molybdopterin converting factor subunit 1 [Pseudenhygromyxa sp. WMMC2535]
MNAEPQTLTILLFAGLRQRAGTDALSLPLAGPGAVTVAALRRQIAAAHPDLAADLNHCRVAVDQAFVDEDAEVRAGQEVALIPPVSGGHDGPQAKPVDLRGERSRLCDAPLALAEVIAAVEHRGAGGVATFTGNVREHSRGKRVRYLEYEAYAPMAVAKMDEIALGVEAEFPGARVAVAHRVGHLEIGESAVVIAASAAHRDEAFRACRAVIERLKQDVPIWKREVDSEGEAWIGQGP